MEIPSKKIDCIRFLGSRGKLEVYLREVDIRSACMELQSVAETRSWIETKCGDDDHEGTYLPDSTSHIKRRRQVGFLNLVVADLNNL